jgi:hypothetical protein
MMAFSKEVSEAKRKMSELHPNLEIDAIEHKPHDLYLNVSFVPKEKFTVAQCAAVF